MQNRFSPLDALRAIAAILVVWQHFSESFLRIPGVAANGTGFYDIPWLVDFGRVGVVCFFLISGFIIPSSLKLGQTDPIRGFAIKRLFRLYPAYWVSILVAIVVHHWMLDQTYSLSTVAANTTMLQSIWGEKHILGLYWTLQIELIFYISCAVLFVAKVLHRPGALLLASLGSLLIFGISQIYFSRHHELTPLKEIAYAPFLLGIMFLGAVYRTAFDASWKDQRINFFAVIGTVLNFGVPVVVVVVYLASGHRLTDSPIRFGSSHLLGLLIFGLGLFYLQRPPRVLIWMGKISYSIYLFHPIAMAVIIGTSNSHAIYGFHVGYYMLAGSVLCLAIAEASYRLIEAPANQWGHRLTKPRESVSISNTSSV
ncbi:acyltransferase [Aquabacterium sp.]|uniref:acyltransferase family protein n=1 Tax=Aquabacterium sp. TaxID=1872578 RepID=UPI0024875B6C|nr:acyltransferase [Aquabacterium sp.]MDI1259294.1 acyltransferase [Aquabacterium sp.]